MSEDDDGYCKIHITATGVLNGNTSLVYAIKNPLTFIRRVNAEGDWYANNSTNENNTLWDISKTVFDPCPSGWHVPQNGTWNDFTAETTFFYIQGEQATVDSRHMTNGCQYNKQVWYPETGYRHCNEGTLYGVGMDSGYSSSTSIGAEGQRFFLRLFISSIFSSHTGNKAHGYAIRCVQE